MSFHERLKRFARKNNGTITGDPGGVLAVLQGTKRIFTQALQTGPALTVVEAMDRAIPQAAPKDPVKARHYALRVLMRNTEVGKSPLAVLSDAVRGQGLTNKLQAKGPQA